jgi:hypothetical protein
LVLTFEKVCDAGLNVYPASDGVTVYVPPAGTENEYLPLESVVVERPTVPVTATLTPVKPIPPAVTWPLRVQEANHSLLVALDELHRNQQITDAPPQPRQSASEKKRLK